MTMHPEDMVYAPDAKAFSGRAEIDVTLAKAQRSFFLHGLGLTVSRVVALVDGAEVAGTVEAESGRVEARRAFGKLAFLSLEDDGGSIQLYVNH